MSIYATTFFSQFVHPEIPQRFWTFPFCLRALSNHVTFPGNVIAFQIGYTVSTIKHARRSLVVLLQALAKTCSMVLALTRDSSGAQIKIAVRKAHEYVVQKNMSIYATTFFSQFVHPEIPRGSGRSHFASGRFQTTSRFRET